MLSLFAFFSAYHQLTTGIHPELIVTTFTPDFLGYSSVSEFLVRNEQFAHLMLAMFLLVFLGLWRWLKQSARGNAILYWLELVVAAAIVGTGLMLFLPHFQLEKFLKHLNWIRLYLPLWILIILTAGGLFAIYELGLRKRQPRFWVVFLFFAVPTCCFLIDPKVTQIQPLAIKRFVPIVFPLFFLLSLSGCSAFLTYPFKNYWYLQKTSFVTLVCLIGVTFFHNSAFLLEQPLFANIIGQIHRMAEKIPSNALIVLSDSNAGWHLQMPLQYMVGHDTLLLPLGDLSDKKVEQVMVDYLRRQLIEGRPVFVLLNSADPPAAALLQQFVMTFKFESRISFTYLPWVGSDQFPGRTDYAVLDCIGFALASVECSSAPGVISIGDPKQDLPCLLYGFYGPERIGQWPYRWTTGNAAMILPFPCSNPPHELTMHVGSSGPAGARLHVSINGSELFDQFIAPGAWSGTFKVEPSPGQERALIELSSDTFVPRKLMEGSTDDRTLGVSLHAIGFLAR